MGWGIVLIAFGTLWLLSTFGLFSWGFWNSFWIFWPLALIVGGLNFILKDSKQRFPILLGVALVGGLGLFGWSRVSGAEGSSQAISEDLKGATQADITLSPGVGRLELSSLEQNSTKAIEGQIELVRGERLEHSAALSGNTLKVRLEAQSNSIGLNARRPEGWKLRLSPKVSLRLNVNSGVGENVLDLSGLKLSDLEVTSGVGRTEVRLSSQGQYSAKIEGGVGALEVNVPSTVGLRLHVSTGLGGAELPTNLISKGEKTYESADYQTAKNRVDLEISSGVGGIVVRR